MKTKKILFILALLCTMVQGAKAQNGILCTVSDQGRVICTDGSIYDNVSAAQTAGKTAVAMIIWVDESSKKGLALHLADDWYYNNTAGAERCNQRNSFQPVAGATWKMASKDEWDTMVNAAGGYQQLRDGFSSVGGANLSTESYYSSSTVYETNPDKYWLYYFHDDEGLTTKHGWMLCKTELSGHLRPCLSFNVLELYTIENVDIWNLLCNKVKNGNPCSNLYVKLTNNISVSSMVGTDDDNSFQGIFDGDGHTLTFTKGTSQEPFAGTGDEPNIDTYCAPFRHVKNAIIKNLHVDGTIYVSEKKAAGFVGESHGALTITNCRSSININSSKNGDGTSGGFVATLSGANNTILIDGCLFDGSFATTNGTVGFGGFIGWGVYNKPTIKNSLMKPSSVDANMLGSTFARWYSGDGGIYEPTITNCYYIATTNLPTDQGKQAYTAAPDGEISKIITLSGTTLYSTASTVSGIEASYNLDEGIARVMPTITDPLSASLTFGTDYTATLNGNAVTSLPTYISTTGNYTLTFTGKGNYTGTKTVNFEVTGTYNAVPVTESTTVLTGNYIVTQDVEITSRITISGNVTLILGEGKTLTAPKGIELSGSNSLTIDGTGTLTINSCDEDKSGIGAVQVGTLTINGGTINVTGGKGAAGIGGDERNSSGGTITINGGVVNATGGSLGAGIGGGYDLGSNVCGTVTINGGQVTAIGGNSASGIGPGCNGSTSAGSLTIGWTNPTDFVNSTVKLNNVSFAAGKIFVFEGTKRFATPSTFSGKKIVPLDAPALSGSGSAEEPYLISNDDDWVTFAYNVYNGTNYNEKFVKLKEDISVMEKCGKVTGSSQENAFSGTFLGGGKTITVTLTDNSNQGTALFCYINGATIRDLTVAGTIASNQNHSSGLVGFANGTNLIENCLVTATLNVSSNYAGGIIGHGLSSNTTIRGCAFDGTINGVGGDHENIGGIWGWSDSATPTLENCLEAGTYTNITSMHPMGLQKATGTITNCYYVNPQMGEPKNACTVSGASLVYTAIPDNQICKVLTIRNITVYMTPICAVSGVSESYILDGNVNITPAVAYSSTPLTFGTDYTATLDEANVVSFPVSLDKWGSYTLILTGTGDYAGEKTIEFMVLPSSSENVTLTDASTYSFKSDVNVNSATYSKTIAEGRENMFHAWLVPFDYTITAADLEKFTFYKINMIANAPDPCQEATDQMWVFLKKLDAGDVLHANMPYVYKPLAAVTDYEFTTNSAVLKAKNTGVIADASTLEDIYNFYATYDATTATAQDPFYYVNIDGDISLGNNGTISVGAFRWIIRKESKFGGSTAYARKMTFFDGESDVTGVISIDNGQLIMDNSWYTLDGRCLDGKPSRAGVYINKGVKVVIK
ncbi:MAG: hypothetical protein J5545_08190 [Bacteroidaceae bacterium]|nr:hypothetical protein [Bacteroidaceae bacterium]